MLSVNEKSHRLHHVLTPKGDKLRSSQNFAIEQNCNQKGFEQKYCVGRMRDYKGAYL